MPAANGTLHSSASGGVTLGGDLDSVVVLSSNLGARVRIDAVALYMPEEWSQIASPSTTGLHQGMDVGDFNQDGELDVVAATDSDGLQLWTGDGGNSWTDVATWTNPDLPGSGRFHTPAFADIDNDGYLDVITSRGTAGGLQAWRFINDGWQQASNGLPVTGTYFDVEAGDFNEDGKIDFVAVGHAMGIRPYAGDGGAFWTPTTAGLPLATTFNSVALGDIDRDGLLDIVAGSSGNGIGIWQGSAGGTGWDMRSRPVSTGTWWDLALGDVNRDGWLDIIGAEEGSGLTVWAGDGAFNWATLAKPVSWGKYASVDAADFNRDGALDVAAGTADDHGLRVWMGDGGYSWTAHATNLPTTGTYTAVRFGDIDHDGALDLVAAKQGNGSVHAWTAGEGAPPSGWDHFSPSGWVTSRGPLTLSIEVLDSGSGLDPNSAMYSLWNGSSWGPWQPATCTGTEGVTTTETLSAAGIFFSRDSGPYPHTANQIRFQVSDMTGNVGSSDPKTVLVDATPPTNPTSFPDSSHWPGGAWRNLNEIRVENWTGDADATSGVSGFSYVFSTLYQLPDTTPETGGIYRVADSGPLPDGEWYIYMRARDAAGNWATGASLDGPYRIDTGPPQNPAGFVSDPATGAWTNDNTIFVDWSPGNDGGSGVGGYAIRWTTTPNFQPVESINSSETFTTSISLADNNSWYLHLKTADNAGNWTADARHWGPFQVDTVRPTSSATAPATSDAPEFVVHWSGIDGLSGVASYDVQVRDLYLGGSWTIWLSGAAVLTDTFHGERGHTYAFRSRAIDRAGNVELWPGAADAITAVTPYEFEAYGLEVTQAVQDLNNSVVLVAGKRTFVRLHVRSLAFGDQGPVEAQLTGWRDGASLGTLLPNNPGGTLTVKESPDRAVLQDSFYFELPSDWLHGTVTLEAEVNPGNTLAKGDSSDNTWSHVATFQDSPEMTVLIVDACYEQAGVTYHADNIHRTMLASWLRRAYPIATLHVRSAAFNPCMDERPSASQSNRILRRNMRDAGEEDDANLRYYGMIDDGGGFERGKGSFNRHVASGPVGTADWGWDFDGSYGDWYGGHELGHTFDRKHAEFCDAAGGDPYPYRFGNISPTTWSGSPDALYGFDIETQEVYPPDWKDVMTYCDNEWISDFTYEGIRDEMLDEASMALLGRSVATAPQTFLEVYGQIITATQQVTLDTFFVTTASWTYAPGTGAYSIRLFDAGDALLATYPFTPLAEHLEQGPVDPAILRPAGPDPADIDEYVPWVPGTKRIAIYQGNQQLASRTVSDHAPQVTLTGPGQGATITGEQITLSWQGSDADGDVLTYWLEYSIDGGNQWQVLGSETRSTQLSLETAFLPGTNQGKFRILASDGVNTTSHETSGTFTVGNKAPDVTILAPRSGAATITGQAVALSAVALDLEDGSLDGAALSWNSSVNGHLGTGELLHVTDLVTGTHTITVTATDSSGATATAGVTVFVNVAVQALYLPVVTRR